MSPLRCLLLIAAGAGLYYAAVVLLGGVLAAVTVPKAYFEWFGAQHSEVALALLQFASFALPVALVVAGGTLAVRRLVVGKHGRAVLLAVLFGLIACFAYELASLLFFVPSEIPVPALPRATLLREVLFPPWWAASGFLAPWLGFAFAAWWSARSASREA